MANVDKLLGQAKEHLDPAEEVLAVIKGTYETKKMGNDWNRAGILVATDHRLVFYAKKMGGYDLEVFPYSHLSSFESGEGVTGHHIKFYASGNEVTLKWIDRNSDVPAFVAVVKQHMRSDHRSVTATEPAADGSPDVPEQIRKLAELHNDGVLTDEEFASKKAELLARM
jgi:Bacterial PH domain/Short C-terminal domain